MIRLTGKCLKIFKTCTLYLCFLALGMSIAIPGPCLLDLQRLMNTDTQQIAFIYTTRYVGYLAGSILGGVILDAVRSKQAVMTLFNLFSGITMLGIPWSPNLGVLTGFMIINGFSLGITDIGANVICLTLWGSESGPYYQGLHFNFGFGALVAPLFAAPFLDTRKLEDNMFMNQENATNSLGFSNFPTAFLGNSSGDSNATDQSLPKNIYVASSTGTSFLTIQRSEDNILLNQDNATNSFNLSNFTTVLFSSNSISLNVTHQSVPKIIYPFTIIGAFCLLVAVLFLVVTILAPTEDASARAKNKEKGNQGCGFTFPMVVLNSLLIFLVVGTEIGYTQMLTTYVVKGPLQLTSSTGSYMTSIFWASFCSCRLISVFLAIKFSNLTLIVSDLVIVVVGSAVLLFLSSYEWSVWVSSVLLGTGIASFFAAAVSWVDSYITVTNKMASVFTSAAALGQMVVPFIISYFIKILPEVLIYVVPVSSILSIIIVFILYLIVRKREKMIVSQTPALSSTGNDSKTKTVNA